MAKEYDVKKAASSDELIMKVNEALQSDWELAGGISRTIRDPDGSAYVQAIFRETEEEKTK